MCFSNPLHTDSFSSEATGTNSAFNYTCVTLLRLVELLWIYTGTEFGPPITPLGQTVEMYGLTGYIKRDKMKPYTRHYSFHWAFSYATHMDNGVLNESSVMSYLRVLIFSMTASVNEDIQKAIMFST